VEGVTVKVNFDCEGVGCNTTAVVVVEEDVCGDEGAAENAARDEKAAAAADGDGQAEAAGEEAAGFGKLGRPERPTHFQPPVREPQQ